MTTANTARLEAAREHFVTIRKIAASLRMVAETGEATVHIRNIDLKLGREPERDPLSGIFGEMFGDGFSGTRQASGRGWGKGRAA